MPDWDDDSPELRANLLLVARQARDAMRARGLPSLSMIKDAHRTMMQGLTPPNDDWVGAFRGEPGVENIGVRIAEHFSTPPDEVASELADFERRVLAAIAHLDANIEPGSEPDAAQLRAILDLSAFAHAEWVRIHPFANGNGRTARLWVNMIAERYNLPSYLSLRPRPGEKDYAECADAAMAGEWKLFVPLLKRMLDAELLR